MIVDSVIRLVRDELSEREWRKLFTALTFNDAEQREVTAYRIGKKEIVIPRGAWSLLPDHVRYRDERVCPPAGRIRFKGELDLTSDSQSFTGQEDALQELLQQEQGMIVRGPGTGKTQIALAFIAAIETNALVLVHTEDIFNQWVEYARRSLPKVKIGVIQGQTWEIERLTIAMVQTIREDFETYRDEYADKFGALVIDECHHVAANTWEMICNESPQKYRVGFTATVSRADGMQKLMPLLIGPVLQKQKIELKIPTHVEPVKSGFYFPYRGRFDWGALQRALIEDSHRNQLIADTASREMQEGNSVLILSRRIEHLETLHDLIKVGRPIVLTGKTRGRKQIVEDFRSGKIGCLLATQLADEALDVPRLNRVILTYPGKHDGRIIQQVGRVLREFPGKENAIIYDIVDDRISVLRRQWMERKGAYAQMGIKVKKHDLHTMKRAVEQRLAAHKIRQKMKGR